MKVAFWSNVHGQTATTSNMMAVAIMMAFMNNNRLMITHNHYHHSTLEHTLIGPGNKKSNLFEFDDMGIDAIGRFIKFNQVDQGCVENYATTIIRNKLDLLTGTTQSHESFFYKELNNVIKMILIASEATYDFVMVDVSAGSKEASERILEEVDLVVINLNQNRYVINDFFDNHYKERNNYIYVLGRYDNKAAMQLKTLIREYPKMKGKVFAVPYSTEYLDAINKGDVIDFFARNKNCQKKDSCYTFASSIKAIAEHIVKLKTIEEDEA